jgi:hypothetical protein
LPDGSFESLEEFLRGAQPDRHQPGIPWSFASESAKIAADALVARIVGAAFRPAWIAVGKNISADLRTRAVTQEIEDAILIAESRAGYEAIENWRKYF